MAALQRGAFEIGLADAYNLKWPSVEEDRL
jgi:hypothetical protein